MIEGLRRWLEVHRQHLTDLGEQVIDLKGLFEEASCWERFPTCGIATLACKQQHRNVPGIGVLRQTQTELRTVDTWHSIVEQQEVVVLFFELGQHRLSVGDHIEREGGLSLESYLNRLTDGTAVVSSQYPFVHDEYNLYTGKSIEVVSSTTIRV